MSQDLELEGKQLEDLQALIGGRTHNESTSAGQSYFGLNTPLGIVRYYSFTSQ